MPSSVPSAAVSTIASASRSGSTRRVDVDRAVVDAELLGEFGDLDVVEQPDRRSPEDGRDDDRVEALADHEVAAGDDRCDVVVVGGVVEHGVPLGMTGEERAQHGGVVVFLELRLHRQGMDLDRDAIGHQGEASV